MAAAYCVLVLATLCAGWIVHRWAGNTLPLPWDDEVVFFWPAVHWMQDGSLLAPELNPERDLMWMPPGMMVVLGTLFKILPIRLEVARWVSWGMLATGYLCCMLWFRRMKRRLLCGTLLSGFFLNGAFTAVGNVARMDAWIWGMGAAAFMLLHSGDEGWRRQTGWIMLGVMPLVHPNGLYFLTAAGLAEGGCRLAARWSSKVLDHSSPEGQKRRICLWGIPVALLWCAYGIYVAIHKTDFVSDISWQFAAGMNIFAPKEDGTTWEALLAWPTVGCLSWYLLFGLHALWKSPRNLWVVGWGGANLMAYVIRHEMWYDIFWQSGWLWLIVLGFQMDIPLHGRCGRIVRALAHGVLFAWAGMFFLRHGFIEGPKGYAQELNWGWGMILEQDTPYLDKGDEMCLKTKLETMAKEAGHPIRVSFKPAGDQLLVLDCFDKSIKPFYPIFSDETADFTIVHVSRYRPDWLETESAVPVGAMPFHERDGTEQWYCFATPHAGRTGQSCNQETTIQ